MCSRQQRLNQQVFAHKKDDGDAVSSTDTSRWSTPSKLCCNSPQYSSDCEEQADSITVKTLWVKSSDKWQGSKLPGRQKSTKAQEAHKQKTNYTANRQVLKLPLIKPLQASNPRVESASLNCIKELKNQVWDLQQQLSEARTENKLLKRLQHRHMMALQHFQNSEGSISQIVTKHNNEARVLQGLLRETRACRDYLAKQLQTTENKLVNTKTSLQRLQLLSQDENLLEREELTFRLAKATADLEEKDKRIMDLEKNHELCQASFKRQIVTEQRKINEARKRSCYLQEQIYLLTKEIQNRERELETCNIYSNRFLKGSNKKGSESKTEEKLQDQRKSANLMHCCYNPVQESLEIKNEQTVVCANVTSEENRQEDNETYADTSEQNSCSEGRQEHQTEEVSTKEKEAPEPPQVLEEQKTEEHENEVSYISEKSQQLNNTTQPKKKEHKIKHNYTFKQTTENLHSGKAAYSNPCDITVPGGVETLSSGTGELSVVNLPAGKSRKSRVARP